MTYGAPKSYHTTGSVNQLWEVLGGGEKTLLDSSVREMALIGQKQSTNQMHYSSPYITYEPPLEMDFLLLCDIYPLMSDVLWYDMFLLLDAFFKLYSTKCFK